MINARSGDAPDAVDPRADSGHGLHVMMVTDFYWPHLGGVEQHVRNLSQALVRRGHRVTVATLRVDDDAGFERDGEVEVHRIRTAVQSIPALFGQRRPWAPPLPDPAARRAIRRLVGELRPDVLHGHDWLARSAPSGDGWPPVVSTLHYYTVSCARKDLLRFGNPCDGPRLGKCVRCCADHYGSVRGPAIAVAAAAGGAYERRSTDRFIAVSVATAAGNELDLDVDTTTVVPNFLPPLGHGDPSDAADHVAQLPADGFFLYVGDFRASKGYDTLLQAYAGLRTGRPLVVIGKRWASTPTSTPDNVFEFEEWPNHAVMAAFERAGVAVVPSEWSEPFGIVAIEAMRGGCPVIASTVGGLVDIVEHDRTGLLVTPGDVDGLRNAMAAMEDDERRNRMALAARAAATSYEADVVVPRIEQIYRILVDG